MSLPTSLPTSLFTCRIPRALNSGVQNNIGHKTMTQAPDLILGFSFSLMPDGSAGVYNALLAKHLLGQLQEQEAACGTMPLVALQWEIADALFALSRQWFEKLESELKLFVVEPPRFALSDIDEVALQSFFEAQLQAPSQQAITGTDAGKQLGRLLESTNAGALRHGLNGLLQQSKLYQHFNGLQLIDLTRPTRGDLFTEYRQMPLSEDFPQGLNRFQRIRVNRLIIERIVDNPTLVKRGQYLSTAGVIEAAFEHCRSKALALENLSIIAHPLHAPRCIEQTKLSLAANGQSPGVQCALRDVAFPWDSSSAQVWCRSLSNWQAYEKVVSALLANNSNPSHPQ